MPLPDGYGVLVGDFQSYGTEQGQWYHVDLNITAAGSQYQAAVDVNEQTQAFQYLVLDGLNQSLFTAAGLSEGWHLLASTPTSGAMDYARSPIFQKPLGCLGLIFGLWNAATGGNVPTFIDVNGNEAGEALIAMVKGSKKLYVFGAPYTSGLGVHDVHCNQGDPPNTGTPPGQFQKLDGIWQDGCVFAVKSDGSLSAYLGKFADQTLNTNNQGLPA